MSKVKYVLITGSDGLIGSESVRYFSDLGFQILGIDNNSRKKFFGEEASVLWNRKELKKNIKNYTHFNQDIQNNKQIDKIFKEYGKNIVLIIHAAAQPSHDWAASNPRLDYMVNSLGTLNLLEAYRKYSPEASFIFTSTNKVYGDNPNRLNLVEDKFRYKVKAGTKFEFGINEQMSIDNTLHSVFGASKTSADILVQEYGKYFELKTVSFRGGCLTGPSHSGTSLHGFLSYLMKCIMTDSKYTIYGYKGKQVRDNIHSEDLVKAFYEFYLNPTNGEVYNIGGGIESNCSMLEAINIGEQIANKKLDYTYSDNSRIGDHIWYVSDLSKFKKDYPKWKIEKGIEIIMHEIFTENINRWKKS
jgi:CDP-paratose 2-epimerase|tara:strand:- start:2956 stop:4032 length:1077 start_codon:yes stop_codon:yes gene_type:complete